MFVVVSSAREERGIRAPFCVVAQLHSCWWRVWGGQGFPGGQFTGAPWSGEGADARGWDQPTRQGSVEIHRNGGSERSKVDVEPVDLELQELKLVEPVLPSKGRNNVTSLIQFQEKHGGCHAATKSIPSKDSSHIHECAYVSGCYISNTYHVPYSPASQYALLCCPLACRPGVLPIPCLLTSPTAPPRVKATPYI